MATTYYFPNYPYNDLREDPFLLEKSNAYNAECNTYQINAIADAQYQYSDCFTNEEQGAEILAGQTIQVCSTTFPVLIPECLTCVTIIEFDTYRLSVKRPTFGSRFAHFAYKDLNGIDRTVFILVTLFTRASNTRETIQVFLGTVPTLINSNTDEYVIEQIGGSAGVQNNTSCYPEQLNAFQDEGSKYRHVFNSPETSFGQPFLGDILKVENVIFGAGKAHFVEVKNNALYKLITKEAQEDALLSSQEIANAGGNFDSTAMFTAYQAYLQIYLDGITRRNYGWSYNSIASYDYYTNVENGQGIKQRMLETAVYLIPGVQTIEDDTTINNFQRESSVYLKTIENVIPLLYPSEVPSNIIAGDAAIEDESRFINSQVDCTAPEEEFDISVVSYYGSLKNIFPNQWGQMYSYETIDTGFQIIFDQALLEGASPMVTIFGGDTFINKFAFKTKLPFFIDNRVNAQNDSDIFYDEIGNVAYPEFWHSARSILYDYITTDGSATLLKNVISIKAHNFDCPNSQLPEIDSLNDITNPNRTYYDGKMYMFAYGIPYFYCESSINVDLRQAFNNREGDFWPRISTGIPDEWVQETFVPIAQDNTYYYNITYSKQNTENFFSHLPVNWEEKLCFTVFPFRAIYSEMQMNFTEDSINNWLIYRPISFFDFPQNYGKLTSLDGIQNKAVLARFENKSLLYNTMITINTSNPQAAYLGNNSLFTGAPPVDFAETDLGYVGSQHKFLLKIPQGQITVDAKRGQIFLISGLKAIDLSALGLGLTRFLNNHLPFEILKYFPKIDIDNHFNGIGLHGVYDSKYDRVIISKLDYSPLNDQVKWDENTNEFYIEETFPQLSTTTTSTTSGGELSVSCEELGNSAPFAILGASTVTNTGNTLITGDLGLFPGTSVTGFPPGIVIGEEHIANGEASSAQDDAEAAFITLGALPPTGSVGADIGGTTITPGVYDTGSSLGITGEVILDGLGDSNAIFIFQIPSTLITASASLVTLINGAKACNVYWLVGSSATLGTTTEMVGNIITNISITFNTNANLLGRAFALTGAVTLDDNNVTRCQCSSFIAATNITSLVIRRRIYITDTEWFCNKSWTLSYNMNTQTWISFHSYIPNWYIAEQNFFYSGLNGGCDLEVIAIEEVTSTTSTSTTRFQFDCDLEGNLSYPTTTTTTTTILDCDLEGTAAQV